LTIADSGKTIKFEVTPVASSGITPGTPVKSVGTVVVNSTPRASAVSISGTPQVGQVLTGNYTYGDVDGDLEGISTFRWLRDDIEIGGETNSTYTLGPADVGTKIKFEVTPVALTGELTGTPVQSAETATVTIAPRISIVESAGSTSVTETGTTDSYTIVLDILPTANVNISLAHNSQITTSPNSLTFTTGNWNVPQTVDVLAVDDTVVEGNHISTITHTATSSDSGYDGISISSVIVNIIDNDREPSQLRGSLLLSGGLISSAGPINNTSQVNFTTQVVAYTPVAAGTAVIEIPCGTMVTPMGGGTMNFDNLSSADSISLVSGVSGTVVASVRFGLAGTPVTFSQPVSFTIPVGTSYNGQTLNVYKSENSSSGWALFTTCLVAGGNCSFSSLSASYFTVSKSAGKVTPSSGGYLLCPNGMTWISNCSTAPNAPIAQLAQSQKCEPYLLKYIRLRAKNDPIEVKKLQKFLNDYENFKLVEDGIYGMKTFTAVKIFQGKYSKDILSSYINQTPTGYVYKNTVKKINEIVCSNSKKI
jgi:hypothetical protein